jgi:uncharacterized membrane protein YphA (DoxX/SURF4 family)
MARDLGLLILRLAGLYLLILVAIALVGPGRFSIDALRARK